MTDPDQDVTNNTYDSHGNLTATAAARLNSSGDVSATSTATTPRACTTEQKQLISGTVSERQLDATTDYSNFYPNGSPADDGRRVCSSLRRCNPGPHRDSHLRPLRQPAHPDRLEQLARSPRPTPTTSPARSSPRPTPTASRATQATTAWATSRPAGRAPPAQARRTTGRPSTYDPMGRALTSHHQALRLKRQPHDPGRDDQHLGRGGQRAHLDLEHAGRPAGRLDLRRPGQRHLALGATASTTTPPVAGPRTATTTRATS